jgi:hypothetical protein
MTRRFTVRHLLAALAWLGLALAPLATPAVAMPMPMDMAASAAPDMDMSDSTPCCPDEPAKPDCAKVCPFMAVCGGITFSVMPGGSPLAVPTDLLAVIVPRGDVKLSGRSQAPPPRPPKASLV